jgi:5,10-methylenetetrahydromethanopterin reductase
MRIGVAVGEFARPSSVDDVVADAARARDDGFATAWMPQMFGFEALSLLAVAGREVDGIELGTSVVPTYPRHPVTMAQEALTAAAASDDRVVLGIGLSHKPVIEQIFGMPFDRPVAHMREYLSVLGPLLAGERVSFAGDFFTVRTRIQLLVQRRCPVLIAALGPQMLNLAGRLADGTITWMTGVRTVAGHVTPAVTAAADDAGRPPPRIVVGLPICVTPDLPDARERLAELYASYAEMPSYRAMLDREGLDRAGDVAIVGDEESVRRQIADVEAAGATDLLASVVGTPAEQEATRSVLRSLLGDRRTTGGSGGVIPRG